MVKTVFLFIATIVFLVSGVGILYFSIKNILTTQTILETQNLQNAMVVNFTERARAFETAVYFIVENDNKLHRTHIVTGFTNNIFPEPMQLIHVRCDENRKLWVIDEYIRETYISYNSGIVVSIVLLILGILFLIPLIKEVS
jgi:hypothetical protein